MRYSIITREGTDSGVYFVVPLEREDDFVDIDCDRPEYRYAQLDEMLQVANEYAAGADNKGDFDTAHYHFSRNETVLKPGMLARAVLKK